MANLLYIRNGDVAKELATIKDANGPICGGPNYYVYSVSTLKTLWSSVLLVSFSNIRKKKRARKDGIAAISFATRPGHRIVQKAVPWCGCCFRTIGILMRFRPTHILCARILPALLPCLLVSRFTSATFVVSLHTDLRRRNATHPLSRAVCLLERYIIRRARGVICHGPFLRRQLLDIGVRESVVFEYNASCDDIVKDDNGRCKYDVSDSGKRRIILYIGRMIVEKGVTDLFGACQQLLSKDRDLKLVFAGSGPCVELLNTLAQEADLHDQVVILGHIARRDIVGVMRQATICVSPTRTSFPEGRCMAAMEALACGVPLICPNYGPFPFLVQDGTNGVLFKPDSTADLGRKLASVLYDKPLYHRLKTGAAASVGLRTTMTYAEAVKAAFGA